MIQSVLFALTPKLAVAFVNTIDCTIDESQKTPSNSASLSWKEVAETEMKYRLQRFEADMNKDQGRFEQFRNLEGDVVSIIPCVDPKFTPGGMGAKVNFLWIVEKTK